MSTALPTPGATAGLPGNPAGGNPPPIAWRRVAVITAVAVGLYFLVRNLPTGSNLNHMDFRVEGKGVLEFCDPANPQFIPVIAARSPVVMRLVSDQEPRLGHPTNFTVKLATASGKPIAPEDLLVAHTRKLHLLVVDPTLSDYQHVHPVPGRHPGDWLFTLEPNRPGLYRVFADFTPAVTARGLYASADFLVPGKVATVFQTTNSTAQAGPFKFDLEMPAAFRAGKQADLHFHVVSQGATPEPVPLQPVMGAYAHLVAFDEARTGFVHMHPTDPDPTKAPDPVKPVLNFKVTIPQPGRYVIWAQVNLGGDEVFEPFWIDVLP
jgi:hypothetical protein